MSSQTCAAVQHLHEMALVHRDLKPANIFVSDAHGYCVKVGDLGMAVSLATLPQIIGGTEGYSAPEQWRDGHRATSRLSIQESEGGLGARSF